MTVYIFNIVLNYRRMGSSIILAGLGMAAVGFAGRYAARSAPQVFFLLKIYKGFYFSEKISSGLCKNGNGRFTTVPLNRYFNQKCGLYFFQV